MYIRIRREVYRPVMLSTLLYGSETCAVKSSGVRWLESFHNRCIRMILGVSMTQQWKEWITSTELADGFGMTENMADILRKHCLSCLGHLARMDSSRLPKAVAFW